ncbi:MAG: hypothetical protein HY998_04130 [candidate division NC10 bacterium]|nr:hypothetical protein [candidate division NC10 bacterium]
MRVTVKLPRSFCRYHTEKSETLTLEVPKGATVREILGLAGLPEHEFGIVVVAGERELLSYQPREGEVLELLPILVGG